MMTADLLGRRRRRHPNYRLVKTHRTYTVEETAWLLGVHKNTVRNWLRDGLEAIDNRRPALILGSDLVVFLKQRRARSKRPLKPGEMFCLKCRAAVRPAGRMAEWVHVTDASANLRGICPSCESLVHRRVSLARIQAAIGDLEVIAEPAGRHIRGTTDPSVNCDLQEGA